MTVWLSLLFAATALAQHIEMDKGVMLLTNENYEMVLSNSPILMIYFYDQKCSECHKMDIEFATAAWMMRETKTQLQKVDFAKVDATLPNQLAIKHNVKRFPTLILIKAIIMFKSSFHFVSYYLFTTGCHPENEDILEIILYISEIIHVFYWMSF